MPKMHETVTSYKCSPIRPSGAEVAGVKVVEHEWDGELPPTSWSDEFTRHEYKWVD